MNRLPGMAFLNENGEGCLAIDREAAISRNPARSGDQAVD
jgi:hypothetical protein